MLKSGFFKKAANSTWLVLGLALVGLAVYFLQAWSFMHTQASLLDEGNYVYKGYLFVSGVYWPYQDYGPWTNHMPLSFLIPGTVQVLFGPGLGTARYFALVLSLMTAIGISLIVRRLAGKWWAVLAMWILAINPAPIKVYSQAISEGLCACLLVWSLFFVLGERRSLWKVLLGVLLATALFMTRLNMTPVLPFVLIYIFWQHGWRFGVYATVLSAVFVLALHGIYFPGILKIWAAQLPRSLTPFLDVYRNLGGGSQVWSPDIELLSRIDSFLLGARSHFFALIGVLFAWLFWPSRKKWEKVVNFRIGVVLSVLFAVLWIAHTWVSVWKDYCVYCYPLYLSFFAPLGIIILVAAFGSWQKKLPLWSNIIATVFVSFTPAVIGFGVAGDLGPAILSLQVPRIRSFEIQPGTVELWRLLANKFDFPYEAMVQWAPAILGVVLGIIILGLTLILYRRGIRKNPLAAASFGYLGVIVLMIFGAFFLPTQALGAGYATYDCGGDVIASADAVGNYLSERVPPGSQVYWYGGLSPVPLLYLPDIKIFPPQLNDGYSSRRGGDSDVLFRFGYWNGELAKSWLNQADIVLIEQKSFKGSWVERIDPGVYDELPPTPPMVTCWEDSGIRIFRRSK